jgi:hypothetical protein
MLEEAQMRYLRRFLNYINVTEITEKLIVSNYINEMKDCLKNCP